MRGFFREQKGITLISLVITIIVLLIITTIFATTIPGSKTNIKSSADSKEASNIVTVQQAVLETYIRYKQTENSDILIGTKITDYSEAEEVEEMFQKLDSRITLKKSYSGTLDDADYYYTLDKTNLEKLGISNVEDDMEYMVNYSTGEVFNLTIQQTSLGTILYVDAVQ